MEHRERRTMEQVRETNKGGDPQNDWEGVERQRKGRGQDACLTNSAEVNILIRNRVSLSMT